MSTESMADLRRERDEARELVRKLTAAERVLTCVYCGHAYPPGSPTHGAATLTEHIKVCEKHPLREALDALGRIARGEGPYSKDRLTHAENTIEAMKNEAVAVLNKYRPAQRDPWACPTCGPAEASDEDGRCIRCGAVLWHIGLGHEVDLLLAVEKAARQYLDPVADDEDCELALAMAALDTLRTALRAGRERRSEKARVCACTCGARPGRHNLDTGRCMDCGCGWPLSDDDHRALGAAFDTEDDPAA